MVAIIAMLVAILLPSMMLAKESARTTACLSNQRQIAIAARMYMDASRGGLYHHHEGWVLDDGTQVDDLPATIDGCSGGGSGNSHAEKPWVIFFYPYLKNRQAGFCPSDPTPRSTRLATNLLAYNGGIETTDQEPPPQSELGTAEKDRLTITSYLLNSIFTHRSCRYALERSLDGFATDNRLLRVNPTLIMFSERNSEALNAPDNPEYGSIVQDDYDTWVGEGALVRWGQGRYADQGWIRYNRHRDGANYVHLDGSASFERWRQARIDQYPDRVVRKPLDNPPR